MRTLVETPVFRKEAEAIWSEPEYEAFTFWLAQNPNAGDVVPGTRGGRKVRWTASGRGKRGGSRVIHYHFVAAEQILLLRVYAKSERENLPANEIAKLLD
jgi:hypothetical protein